MSTRAPAGCWSRAELAVGGFRASRPVSKTPASKLVFLLCRNDAPTIRAYLASIEAGHAVAMLDSALSLEFQDRLIALYEPDLLLSSAALGREIDGYELTMEGDLHIGRRQTHVEGEIHPDLALLLSTSGSTGTPKFVRLTHGNIESNAHSIREALGITAADRPITSLPIHYSYGLSVINSHLAAGAEIVLTHMAAIAPGFWDAFRTYGCTSFSGVPYSYQILRRLDFDKLNIPTLNTLTQAGGRLHTDLVSHFHKIIASRGGRMFVMYGQTEATARIAIIPAEKLTEKLGSVGQSDPWWHARDPHGRWPHGRARRHRRSRLLGSQCDDGICPEPRRSRPWRHARATPAYGRRRLPR